MIDLPDASAPHPVDIHVGNRIRVRRVLLKLSQGQLGEVLGVSFQQLQKYERGLNRVSASKLWMLSEALDVSITYFFEGLEADDHVRVEASEEVIAASEFIWTAPAVELARAFSNIKNVDVQHAILELTRSCAQTLR